MIEAEVKDGLIMLREVEHTVTTSTGLMEIAVGIISESFGGSVASPPHGYQQALEVLGNPNIKKKLIGKGYVADSKWESKHCITISESQLVGYHRRIYMNKVVAPNFKEALRRCDIALKKLGIRYAFNKIGCFNPRYKRFDESLGPSLHAFAAAFDINPDTNKSFHRPANLVCFGPGWRSYSDIPEAVVKVFEHLGFQWGGRWGTGSERFCDPMHFQYCTGY